MVMASAEESGEAGGDGQPQSTAEELSPASAERPLFPPFSRGLNEARRSTASLRKPPVEKFGAIDVGTNSIHLVMVEISPDGDFRILGRDKQLVQLGKGGFVHHILTAQAMDDGM